MRAAALMQRDVIVPAVILAELYRGAGHNQAVDACLARETGIRVRDTDRPLARLVGGVLTGAKADSRYLADAHVVAAAVKPAAALCSPATRMSSPRLPRRIRTSPFSRSPNRERPRP